MTTQLPTKAPTALPASGRRFSLMPANDALINKTLTSSNLSDLYRWQDYLSAQLPVEWAPGAVWPMTEIASNLRGVLPQSPTLNINPENWYFVK